MSGEKTNLNLTAGYPVYQWPCQRVLNDWKTTRLSRCRMIWLLPLAPFSSVSSTGDTQEGWERKTSCGRDSGEGGEAISHGGEKAWSSINHSILFGPRYSVKNFYYELGSLNAKFSHEELILLKSFCSIWGPSPILLCCFWRFALVCEVSFNVKRKINFLLQNSGPWISIG